MTQTHSAAQWSEPLRPSKEWLVVGLSLLVAFVILLIWAQIHNALGVSRNDDWVYLHMEKWFLESGIFIVDSESMTNASGLIFSAAPIAYLFGFSIVTLQIFVGVVGLVGVFASWLVIRTFLSKFWTLVAVLSLVLTPYWGSLSLSFMTDVPAFTFQTLGLLFFLYSVRGVNINWYWAIASLLVSLIAFSCREYAIVGLVAVSLALLISSFRNGITTKSRLVLSISIAIFACLAYSIYYWRTTLSNAKVSSIAVSQTDLIASVYLVLAAIVTASIFMWPALASGSIITLIKQKPIWRLGISTLLFVGLMLSGIRLASKRSLTIGNYFGAKGSYAETLPLGTFPNLIPDQLFLFLQWAGVVSLALIGVLIFLVLSEKSFIKRVSIKNLPNTFVDSPQMIIILFVFGTVAVLALVAGLTTAPLFDRYLLPLFPYVSALLILAIDKLGIRSTYSKVRAAAVLSLIGLLGFIYVDNSLTLDGAQWKIASQLEAEGFSPETIDGGYMWFGYHQNEVATGANLKWSKNWWTTLYENPSICAQVGIGEVDPNETLGSELISHLSVQNAFGLKYNLWAIATPNTCH